LKKSDLRVVTLAVGLFLGIVAVSPWSATAGGWADFLAAFTTSPCQDGWLGCVTADGDVRDPNPVKDSEGRPTPTDLRIGWDLQATASYSPFSGLSKYTGKLPSVGTGRKTVAAKSGSQTKTRANDRGGKAQDAAQNRSGASKSSDKQTVRTSTQKDVYTDNTKSTEKEVAVTTPVAQPDIVETPEVVEPVAEPVVEPVAVVEEPPAADTAVPDGDGEAVLAIGEIEEEPASPQTCEDLKSMEIFAAVGDLGEGLVTCLDDRYQAAAKQTEKNTVSRLLMADAWNRGDRSKWEQLVVRHLEEVDQSDPDLCYKYATQLSRKGPSRARGVIRWSGVALENKTRWIGDQYTRNVYQLYKLRTAASMNLWAVAQSGHTTNPDEASLAKSEKARNQAKVMAREWYDYSKQAGKDPTKALQACISAAGGAEYCEGG